MRLVLILLGIGLICFSAYAIWHTVDKGNWEDFVAEMILCVGGVVMYWFSDEFTSYSGRYGITRDRYYIQPESYIKFGGLFITVACGILLLVDKNL